MKMESFCLGFKTNLTKSAIIYHVARAIVFCVQSRLHFALKFYKNMFRIVFTVKKLLCSYLHLYAIMSEEKPFPRALW